MKCQLGLLMLLLELVYLPVCAGENHEICSDREVLQWSQLPDLPNKVGVAGPFAGVHNNVLIVAGGANFPEKMPWDGGQKVWYDDIYVLEITGEGQYQWRSGFQLARPLAYGVSITTDQGVICIGGCDGQKCYDDVFILKWDSEQKQIVTESLPSLPKPCAFNAAAKFGDVIYVAGGQSTIKDISLMKNFWALDLGGKKTIDESKFEWEQLPAWPGPGRVYPVLAAQSNGEENCLYLFSGRSIYTGNKEDLLKDAYQYNPKRKTWKRIADSPRNVQAGTAVAAGSSHIFVFGGVEAALWGKVLKDKHPGFPRDILAFHTITDTWVKMGTMPTGLVTTMAVPWNESIIITSGEIRPGMRLPEIWKAQPITTEKAFGVINYIVLIGYMLILVVMGLYFSKREKGTDDFFLGGKRIPWWAAGVSIYATQLSALTFMATPAKAFTTNWQYLLLSLGVLGVVPIIILYFLPFFRRLNVPSAYEYLELRFNLAVRLYGSASFLLFQLGRMSIVVLLPAIALGAVTGMDVYMCIIVMGILCTIYTVLGGIEAVIWTDVIQVIVLMGGAILSLILIFMNIDGGFEAFIDIANTGDKFKTFDFSFDFTAPTVIVLLIGWIGNCLVPYASDQVVIQRYLTTRDEKSAAKGIWLNGILSIISLVFFVLGTALFVFYKTKPQLLDPLMAQNDGIFPWFIVQQLPAGLSGLVIAGIFAAAMSSLDSSMNSMATVITTDFYRRFKTSVTDEHCLKLARWLTLILGVIGTGIALVMATYEIKSLWDYFMVILGLLGSGLAGLFILGIFTRRANGPGALIGAITSAVVLYYAQKTNVHFFIYGAIGVGVCFTVGYIVSLIIPTKTKNQDGLTFYTMPMKIKQKQNI